VAKDIGLRAARSVGRAFNPALGLIPLGVAAEEAHTVGDNDANIDGLITSALLLWAAQQSRDNELRRNALANAGKNADVFIQADNSVIQSATLDPGSGRVERLYTHKGSAPDSIWTRAQAWAMLNYSLCAMLAPEETRLLATAERVAQWWIDHVPSDHVAYWDFSVEKTPATRRDTSGTAIALSALLRIAALTPDKGKAERYRAAAEATARALAERHLKPSGLLADGCFDPKNNTAVANELIWGSYYLLESLGVLSGKLAPKTV
jgi:unsaturated chondroitin disaccharide hydrolase